MHYVRDKRNKSMRHTSTPKTGRFRDQQQIRREARERRLIEFIESVDWSFLGKLCGTLCAIATIYVINR